MINEIARNLKKEFIIEYRNRYAINISLAFAGISTLAISLVSGGIPFSTHVQAIMLWVIMFFSAMNGLSHIFFREEEEKTSLLLRLNISAESVFISKLIFNIIFFFIIQVIISALFIFFLSVDVKSAPYFILSIFLGGLAVSASTTIFGAMVAKAGGKGSLFTVISFPILLPVLWIAISTTKESLEKVNYMNNGNIIFFLAFSGVIISLSFLLFRYVWLDQ
ncbi:heme exporter protein CcmB [Spirochaetota bacterium]